MTIDEDILTFDIEHLIHLFCKRIGLKQSLRANHVTYHPRDSYSHLIQRYPLEECLLDYSDFLTTVETSSQYTFHERMTSSIYTTNLIDTIIENVQAAANEENQEINVVHWRALLLYLHTINMLRAAMLVFFTDTYDHDEGLEVLRECIEFCNGMSILNNADGFFNSLISLLERAIELDLDHMGLLLTIVIHYAITHLLTLSEVDTEQKFRLFINKLRGTKVINLNCPHGRFDAVQFLT